MREIRFRCWVREYIDEGWGNAVVPAHMAQVHSIHLRTKRVIIAGSKWGNMSRRFDEIELMQYTGLRDKNGVEIYEGDIVGCKETCVQWEVGFSEGSFVVTFNGEEDYLLADICADVEVVGNTHEGVKEA
jgi:hypothetical protein